MKAEDWPPCLPKRDWQEVRSLTDTVEIFAEDLVNHYRPEWNLQTPGAPKIPSGGLQWYLRRETGLRAFARYEAGLRMKHFSRDGLITGAGYCACRLQEVLFNWGWREALSPGCIPPKWEEFILWPEFAPRLQLWKSRKALARHSPDTRIKLYALLYDRAPVPLEFCSEAWSVRTMNRIIMCEDWPGQKTTANRESIRRWRRNLGLKLSPHVVIKTPHPLNARKVGIQTDEILVWDHVAAKKIGLPFDCKAELNPLGSWRIR